MRLDMLDLEQKIQRVKVHLEIMLKTQDGSMVLRFTQYTYNISYTQKPRNEKLLTIEA